MVPLKWSLPSPSHALMSVDPKFDEVKQLTTNDCFYARKMMFEKGWLELYFSPLSNYPLVNAKIRAIAFDQQVNYYTDRSVDRPVIPDVEIPSEEGTVWIGLNMTQSVLRSTKRLVLCILPEDGSLSPFLRDIEVYDGQGEQLSVSVPEFPLEQCERYHYFDEISSYYADNFIQIDLNSHFLSTNPFSTYPSSWETSEGEEKEELVWLQLKFPVVFNRVDFAKVRFLLNTYPVVNRKLVTMQHDFTEEETS